MRGFDWQEYRFLFYLCCFQPEWGACCPTRGDMYVLGSWHLDTVFDVRFTPNGKSLVTGSNDHTLKYWDCSSCNPPLHPCEITKRHLDRHAPALDEQTRPQILEPQCSSGLFPFILFYLESLLLAFCLFPCHRAVFMEGSWLRTTGALLRGWPGSVSFSGRDIVWCTL